MRHGLILSVLGLLLLAGCGSEGLSPEQSTFTQSYEAAHQSGDYEAVLALHCLDGVTEKNRFLLAQAILIDMEHSIRAISFQPIAPDDAYRYEFEGQIWVPNLEPKIRLLVEFGSEQRLHSSFLIGEKGGQLFFINPKPSSRNPD